MRHEAEVAGKLLFVRGRSLPNLFSGVLCATALAAFCLLLLSAGQADAATDSYIDFDRHATYEDLSSGSKNGAVVKKLADGSGMVQLASSGLNTGTDSSGAYNGGRYYWGSLTSQVYSTSTLFDAVVPSWNATTPSGTWLQLEVRVRSGGNWTPWFNMGVWAKGTGDVKRHSVNGQRSGDWHVLTDTLQSIGSVFGGAYQYRLKLFTEKQGISPEVRSLAFTSSDSYRHGDSLGVAADKSIWGRDLQVPERSQMIYPDGGEVWCSPTSLSMVMAYWSNKTGNGNLNQTVPTVAHGTYDYVYKGNGNWPFNTAYASAYGLRASVNRFSSLGQVERWIDRGVPVVASVAWDNRYSGQQLSGAPITTTYGHLLVVRGFTSSGNVIVNDPAASSNSGVRRVYDRYEFYRAWFQTGSGGVAYLVYPKSWRIPDKTDAHGSW